MRTALLTLQLCALALCASAQTGLRLTEEATTAAAGSLLIETRVNMAGAPNVSTGEDRTRWDVPILRLVHSPAGNVEMDVEWVGWVVAEGETESTTVSDWGDVTLRAKVRLVESRDRRTAFGARFLVSLPETRADHGLGPNMLRMAVEALLSCPLAHGAFHANAGLLVEDKVHAVAAQNDFLSFGLALEWPIAAQAAIIAEVAGRTSSRSSNTGERSEARLGLQFSSGRFRWDLGIRRSLVNPTNTWGATVGLAWVAKGR